MLARKKREGGEEKNIPDEVINKTNKSFVNASLFDTKPRRSLDTKPRRSLENNDLERRDFGEKDVEEPRGLETKGLQKSRRDVGGTIVTRERRYLCLT